MNRVFPELWNARDLGGHLTAAGNPTRMKAFVRADLPNRLTPAGIQEVLDYGIRTVIDLRFPDDLEKEPNPLVQRLDALDYCNLSLLGESWPAFEVRYTTVQFENFLRSVLDFAQVEIAQILRAMINTREGGILFHCRMGKDRTGLVAILLLALAGVADEAIAADYALTAVMLQEEHERFLSQFTDPEERKQISESQLCPPEYAQQALAHLTDVYSGVSSYLIKIGLSHAEIDALRRRLV